MHRPISIIFASVAAAFALPALAGPLDPPPGPVASTMKPLDQVEPRTAISAATTPGDADSLYRITQAGSYYLAGNVLGQSGKSGIEITVSDVTIDLMGFEMKGANGSLDGIKSIGNLGNITVRNGTIAIWRQDGIDLATARDSHVDQVRAAYNYDVGVRIGGSSVVTGVTAPGSSNGGILAGYAATISGCTASGNSGPGISAGNGSTVSGCVSVGNVDHGFVLASGCTVTSCSADDNSGNGIYTADTATITACTARSNGAHGITAGNASTVTGCTGGANSASGIAVSFSGSVIGCTASKNLENGISANSNVTITGNTAVSNTGDGISVVSYCVITANSCNKNHYGIHAIGSRNRIDGNTLSECVTAVDIEGFGNFVVRNTSAGNGGHFVFGGQTQIAGPIITDDGIIADSVSPWANFVQ